MNHNVLVVEDDDTIRRLLIEYLRQHSYSSVIGARDGVDALHEITRTPYRLVILDLMMPYMSGVDFLDSLSVLMRDASAGARLTSPPRVIVITATPHEEFPSDALAARFPDFVRCVHRKPLDVAALAECVASELGHG